MPRGRSAASRPQSPPADKTLPGIPVVVTWQAPMLHLVALAFLAAQPGPVPADIVLKGGTIYDGSCQPGVVGDVLIKGDRVVAVGTVQAAGNPKVIDCTGLVVAPGFIDLHTHSDGPITMSPTRQNLSYTTQGVTTIVTGNCG